MGRKALRGGTRARFGLQAANLRLRLAAVPKTSGSCEDPPDHGDAHRRHGSVELVTVRLVERLGMSWFAARPMGRVACGCGLVLVLAGAWTAAAAVGASAVPGKTVKLSADVREIIQDLPPINGTPQCEGMIILEITSIPSDIVSYQASVVQENMGLRQFSGPGFPNPVAYGAISYHVPKGQAAWMLSAGGGRGPCLSGVKVFSQAMASGIEGVSCDDLKLSARIDRWETGRTVFDYSISGVKSECGPVSLRIAGVAKTISADAPSVSGQLSVPQRVCETTASARQRGAEAGGPIGRPAQGTVIYGRDLTGPDGEQLTAGDQLCSAEFAARISMTEQNAFTTGGLRVGANGVGYIDLGIRGMALEDRPAGVQVTGLIMARVLELGLGDHEHVDVTPPAVGPGFSSWADIGATHNIQTLSSPSYSHVCGLTGFAETSTQVTFNNCPTFTFNRGYIGSGQSVTINGNVEGLGAVRATGAITVTGHVELTADEGNLVLSSHGTIFLGV